MLVLSRRRDETIVIKQEGVRDIVITFLAKHSDGQIKLGFDAPKSAVILRGELLEEREQQ